MGLGLGRGELAILLWGGCFGFLWLYLAVVIAVARRSPAIAPSQVLVEQDTTGALHLSCRRSPLAPGLCDWAWQIQAIHGSDRRWGVTVALAAATVVPWTAYRGTYQANARWVLQDALGFFRWESPVLWSGALVQDLIPEVQPLPKPVHFVGGPQARSGHRRRIGDPFDVRKYVPGDDLRRLYWPLFAHSGNLFVRQPDPAPPPSGLWVFVLDTASDSNKKLDRRLAVLAGWIQRLDQDQIPWQLWIPGQFPATGSDKLWLRSLTALNPQAVDQKQGSPWPQWGLWVSGPSGSATVPQGFRRVEIPEPADPTPTRRRWWQRS